MTRLRVDRDHILGEVSFGYCFPQIFTSFVFQDVVEIMKESLYDKYVDEHGLVDFCRSGGMSQPKEAKRFLSALNAQSELLQKDCFSISVCSLAFPSTSGNSSMPTPSYSSIFFPRKYTVWQIGLA